MKEKRDTKETLDNNLNIEPNIMNELCGNKEIYNNILLWLRNFNYKTKISTDSCIIVTGK